MLRVEIPQREPIELQHAVFDVNGTLAVDGVTTPEIVDRVRRLSEHLTIHILTAGTHGNLSELERAFDFPLHRISTGAEKTRYVQQLGPPHVVAFGNGTNDAGMLQLAAIGIAVIAAEGISKHAVQNAD